MEIMTRAEAHNAGMKKYFTGEPCRNGHTSKRYTSTGGCVQCVANHRKQFIAGRKVVRLEVHPDDEKALRDLAESLNIARSWG